MSDDPWWIRLLFKLVPSERSWVTIGLFSLAIMLLLMARENPGLWDVKLFEVVLQAVVLTGLLNMVGAFHFSANKADEAKTENTRAAFNAIEATARTAAAAGADPSDPETKGR